jgi:hypothetical protein
MVGALSPTIHLGDFYLTPEIALLIDNAFAYAVGPKGRFRLTLVRIEQMTSGCYDFIFKSDRNIGFQAGQYLDWTLDVHNPDDRGNRRSPSRRLRPRTKCVSASSSTPVRVPSSDRWRPCSRAT